MNAYIRTREVRKSWPSRLARTARNGWLFALLASVSACGGGGSASEPAISTSSVASVDNGGASASVALVPSDPAALPSDQEIADRIYQGRDRTPSDFYQESLLPAPSGYTTTHIKNTMIAQVMPAAGAPVYELCTDDWNEALAWSEEAAQRMPRYANLTETNANKRYFEFVRARPAPSDWLERQRVFRCSYLERSTADLRTLDGPGGSLNRASPAAADVKELAEYLWQFTYYNNYGNAVLASNGDATDETLEHALIIATLVRASTPDACDRIDIFRWIHSVDVGTGTITRRVEPIREISARESGGFAMLCSA
jgi:hypothetical protein